MKIALVALSFFAFAAPMAFSQQTQPPRTPDPVIRITSQEVMLDVVVRDKKGRPVHDLTAGDIEVTDDGVPQKIRGFRMVKGAGIDGKEDAATSAPAGVKAGARTAADASQPIRLITIAFEGLGTDGRKNARMAVTELLKNETGKNLYFGVFSIDHGLRVLQPYTSDKEAVKTAGMNATPPGQ